MSSVEMEGRAIIVKIFHHLPGKVQVVTLHRIGKFRNEMDAMKSMR